MRRRSGAGGEPVKTRRRKAATLKRGIAPKTVHRRSPSAAGQETKVARLTRELNEALEQLTATSEVLKVISSSPGALEPVFQTMVANATRLCEANFGQLLLYQGNGHFRVVAMHNPPPAFAEFREREPTVRASGVLARLVTSKHFQHIPDCIEDASYRRGDADFVKFVELNRARTFLQVPMLKDEELIGVIGIYRREIRPFTDKQIALVQNFAAQAVIAIENARLLTELRQRTTDLTERTADLTESLEQQTATSDVLRVISRSPGELQPVFDAMLENATRICGANFGQINLYEEGSFRPVAHYNVPAAYAASLAHTPFQPHPQSGLGTVARTHQVVHIEDIRTLPPYLEGNPSVVAIADLAGARTYFVVPMLKENELIGAITIYRQEVKPFTVKQTELVANFAKQAVIAIENTRLLRELRESCSSRPPPPTC